LPFLDHEKFYRECDRVLVPGGVIAAYTYSCQDFRVIGHPNASELSEIMNEVIHTWQLDDFCRVSDRIR